VAVVDLQYGHLQIPPASALNSAARGERQLGAAGQRSVIPLTYGQDRIGGLILNVIRPSASSTNVLVSVLWGYALGSVSDVTLSDQALPTGATVTTYLGSQTTADPALVAAFTAAGITYTDTLQGYAYSVVDLPIRAFEGRLDLAAVVTGRKVYDPREDSTQPGGSGSQRLADPSTWQWSNVPALCLADWLANSSYGCGRAVDWATVATVANANEAYVGTSSQRRRLMGLSFVQATPASEVLEALRAYAGCWVVPGAAGMRLIADADTAAVASYSHASGQIASIEPLALRDMSSQPTVVEVMWTDRSVIPWRERSQLAQLTGAGSTRPWRLSQVRLPGIQRAGQAAREAAERLLKLTLTDRSTSIEVFDVGVRHEVGDVIQVTHPLGLTAAKFRVTAVEMPGHGRWRLALAEHDPAVYSDLTTGDPTTVDPSGVIGDTTEELLSAPVVTLAADAAGLVTSWAGSGTQIRVTEGNRPMTFHTTLAPGRFTVGTPTVSPANYLVPGARSGSGSRRCVVADHAAGSAHPGSPPAALVTVTYPLTIRNSAGTDSSVNLVQTLQIANAQPSAGGGSGSAKVTKTNVGLGTQAGGQSAYAWTAVSAVCVRGLMSRLRITATAGGLFDVQVRDAGSGGGNLWFEAVDCDGTAFDATAPVYIEGSNSSVLHVGIRNRATGSRTFTLADLRVEKFA
jgi:hypothetical protein